MRRAYTAAVLAGLLLISGLGLAQQPQKADGDKIMLLTKEGRPPRRCQVLKSWKHPSGGTAYEVKALDNGEVMTVIEHGEPEPAVSAKPAEPLKPIAKPAETAKKPEPPKTTAVKKTDVPKVVAKTDKPASAKPADKTDKSTAAKAADKTDKSGVVKTAAKTEKTATAKTASKTDKPAVAKAGDPILSPAKYSGDSKVGNLVPADAPKPNSAKTEYTKQPVPLAQRWFAFWEKPAGPQLPPAPDNKVAKAALPPKPPLPPKPATPALAKAAAPAPAKPASPPSETVVTSVSFGTSPLMQWRSAVASRPSKPSKPARPATAIGEPIPVVIEARYHPDRVVRLIGALKDDDLPSLREVAAESLAHEAQQRPDVHAAMIESARMDPAPTVRAACCRCLAGMQVKSPDCMETLHMLESDSDPVVRAEATMALSRLEVSMK
jgi:hypothetical protein